MKVVIRKKNGKYQIPLIAKLRIRPRIKFYYEYQGKLCFKEKRDNKELYQISSLVCALNIRKRKERLKYVYEKACDFLDSDFYGKNICEFKDNRCVHDRLYKKEANGCCQSNDGTKQCLFLKNQRCQIKCLACKFHVCSCLRCKGIKYRINDFLVLKYLYNWKQKIMVCYDFFMTEDEVLKDIYHNSLLRWALFTKTRERVKQ